MARLTTLSIFAPASAATNLPSVLASLPIPGNVPFAFDDSFAASSTEMIQLDEIYKPWNKKSAIRSNSFSATLGLPPAR